MSQKTIHQCQCENCQSGKDEHTKMIHHQINVMMSRMDEQQRRWYAALEANRHGHGGVKLVQQISGLSAPTVRQGQRELSFDLKGRPEDRIRLPGAGRPYTEKKILASN